MGMIESSTGTCIPDVLCTKELYCTSVDNTYCADQKNESYLCQCINGFNGNPRIYCSPINYCAEEDICGINEVCQDLIGSYRCQCIKGYTRVGSSCVDVNECELWCPCQRDQRCVNTIGSFECLCLSGYKFENGQCVDIDECAESMHNCNPETQVCQNWVPGFSCQCKWPQYFLQQGHCVNNDECKTGMFNCPKFSECLDTEGGYSCVCTAGTKAVFDDKGGTLVQCEDVNECEQNLAVCDEHANCVNTHGGYYCKCKSGYYGTGLHGHCYEKTNCSSCDKNAVCLRTSYETLNCTCQAGFSGDGIHCTRIDVCARTTCHPNAECISTDYYYPCRCKYPYEGDGINVCKKIDFCNSKYNDCPFGAKCVNLNESVDTKCHFKCICPTGFEFDYTSRLCKDINECATSPCPEQATCVNHEGFYSCVCLAGYMYDKKSNTCQDVDECALSSMCLPHGKCKNTPGGYQCICDSGYSFNQVLNICVGKPLADTSFDLTACVVQISTSA
ncbi:unnamed protein product [Soboliphyme baturini]|uniref:EGF-like domain-containing protein n=1 Tax=Soboliphyme baturini TaxID=241478 RepID=A0A183J6I8_9BILA|nr:unnamed protein product [Soboliphyme baturini]